MAKARVTHYVVEALVPTDAFNPATPTGAGVSQHLIEVLGAFAGKVRVSQHLIEVLMADSDSQSPAPTTGGVRVYGHAT